MVTSTTNEQPTSRTERWTQDRRAENWLFGALVAVVALAPLPFGSNRPLPAAALALAVGFLLALWGGLVGLSIVRVRVEASRIAGPLLLYALVCLWIFLQWAPWLPASLADPVWREAARLLRTDLAERISVNPEATLTGLMHLATYGGVFWLSLQLMRDPERARIAVRAVALIGCAYALYGLVVFLSGNGSILIYRKWAYPDSLTGTFVNRNSFATFAGLCLLCAATLLLERIRHLLALERPLRVKSAMMIEELAARSVWITVATLTISIALVLSASRAGVFASMIGLLCLLGVHLARRTINRKQLLAISAAVAAIAAATYATSGDLLLKRTTVEDVGNSIATRNEVYGFTLDAIRTSPWTGTGFGTFPDVFPAYRGDEAYAQAFWDKAHNTYLENALELGIPAAVLLTLSVALLALRALRGVIERRREKVLPAIGVAATVIVGLHSFVDFSLQIPAVSVLYAFLLGLSVSQSWSASRP